MTDKILSNYYPQILKVARSLALSPEIIGLWWAVPHPTILSTVYAH